MSTVCQAYCNANGYYVPATYCNYSSSNTAVYCCGSQYSRYCCTDSYDAVYYPAVTNCPNDMYWIWPYPLVIFSILIVIICLPSLIKNLCCFQYCCEKCQRCHHQSSVQPDRSSTQQSNDTDVITLTGDETTFQQSSVFNPRSPNAFTPPSYTAPSVDPPKYEEIAMCVINTGFIEDESPPSYLGQPEEDDSPPSYTGQPDNVREAFVDQPDGRDVPPEYTEVDIDEADEQR